jgi:FkbM family methyltransferase
MVSQLRNKDSLLKIELLQKIRAVESFTNSSKIKKCLKSPFRYSSAILFTKFIYPLLKRGIHTKAVTFYNQPLSLILPAGTDIYLTGAKTHDSEIRLAKFAINHLSPDDRIIDIGAHVGFFTLLFAKLVGNQGKVISFEPSLETFKLLTSNVGNLDHVKVFNHAISNTNEQISFYEFPVLYSEYNSEFITQFESEKWFLKNKPNKVSIPALTIDSIVKDHSFVPNFIKVDVEGNELKVLQGAKDTLLKHHPVIMMEYLEPNRHNESHRGAASLLKSFHYDSFIINKEGHLERCENIEDHIQSHNLESDNIVFCKK